MCSSNDIKSILDRRIGRGQYEGSGRLAFVENRIMAAKEVKSSIDELISLHEQLKRDPTIFENSQSIIDTLNHYDLATFSDSLSYLLKELERLKERFGRSKIQIAFIGKARQGKSSFLQRITGLTDSTIPSSAGSDCTGAISTIENVVTVDGGDYFEATIEYYSQKDFVVAVNNKLRDLFPESSLAISSVDDIPSLAEREEFQNIPSEETERKNFYDVYIDQYKIYRSLIGKDSEPFYNEDIIAEYVAKYKKFARNSQVVTEYKRKGYKVKESGNNVTVYFCKFVAVRMVYIKKNFRIPNAGDIVLVDTIGLGNKDTQAEDEEKMFEVLKHESDAAVFVYKPNEDGNSATPADQIEILEKIALKLDGYAPNKWIVGAINKKSEQNSTKKGADYKDYEEHLEQQRAKIAGQKKCIAWCEIVDGVSEDEVRTNLILPLLHTINANLDDIDISLMRDVNIRSGKVYEEFYNICTSLSEMISDIVVSSVGKKEIIDRNVEELPLKPKLHEYVSECFQLINKPCKQIIDDLYPTVDKITDFIPSKNSIVRTFNNGPQWIPEIYIKVMDKVRAKILAEIKDVSAKAVEDMQMKIKETIAQLLFDDGLLGKINLKSASTDIPTVEWMRAFAQEILVKYPILQSAFNTVSNFEMRIEGYIYSKCICACEMLRPNKTSAPVIDENLTVEEKADIIWQSIFNNVLDVKSLLYEELGLRKKSILKRNSVTTEMLQPNLILWCVVDTFEQEIRFGDGAKELDNLYYEFGQTLWYDEIIKASKVGKEQKKWLSLYGVLNSLCDRNRFQLIIK